LDTFYEIKPGLLDKSALALGFFDGVHPGHQVVIRRAVEEAQRLGARSGIVTFKEHPRALTLGKSPPLLTTLEQRLELFSALGVQSALVLSFTEELCRLDPEDYVRQVLLDALGAKSLSVGFNHRFGRNRVGTPQLLAELGDKFDYVVHVAPEVIIGGSEVSSSRIRDAVLGGQAELAHEFLSRPYALCGKVVRGEGRGHKIGFPTANIEVDKDLVLPKLGVYAGRAVLSDGQSHDCVVNVGVRPTFENEAHLVTEVHIFDYSSDIYDQKLQVELWKYLRSEKKFGSVDELRLQIAEDAQNARTFMTANPVSTVNVPLNRQPV
jgi:riboflavin kinase/FMN adenylyltransferase